MRDSTCSSRDEEGGDILEVVSFSGHLALDWDRGRHPGPLSDRMWAFALWWSGIKHITFRAQRRGVADGSS
jgi:hypothetical protein